MCLRLMAAFDDNETTAENCPMREYKRICKHAGCNEEFAVAASSLDEDRTIGLSEPEYCPKHRVLQARSYSRIACHHYDVRYTKEGERRVREVETEKNELNQGSGELEGKVFDPWTSYGPGGVGRFTRPLRAFLPNTEFSPQQKVFPIAEQQDALMAALEKHQVVVLVGQTGSGKSTYIPWYLLTGGVPGALSKWARRGPICVTQPRIQATQQIPRFIANALNGTSVGIGSQVGFSHSKSESFDRRARLIFKTDGKLLNDIVSGAIGSYSIVMIDEAHERSVNIELILGLLRDQLYLYPHLRVIIASATIDYESFQGYFGGPEAVPLVKSEGRSFGITMHWWGSEREDWWRAVNDGVQPTREQLPQAIAELVTHICKKLDDMPAALRQQEDGHILVFLPGSREIDQTVAMINSRELKNVVAMPLYAQRPLDEQEAALNPQPGKHPKAYGKRRVVVSTNVAETSLTVEGVKYVIDSGYIKNSYWNPHARVNELRTLRHSQAGCKQRFGRAGRVSPGHAYALYGEEQFAAFPEDTAPEIARASLEDVVLTAKAAGVRTRRDKSGATMDLDMQWIPMPADRVREREDFEKERRRAFSALRQRGAIDSDGDLTMFGLELRGMPATLDVARIFTEAERFGMGFEAATLLPFLALDGGVSDLLLWDQDWNSYHKWWVRLHQLDLVHGCHDDLDLYMRVWLHWSLASKMERAELVTRYGFDTKVFERDIEAERRRIIEMAMDWRKAESRLISLDKLDAFRALIAFCLQKELYAPLPPSGGANNSELGTDDDLGWDAVGQYDADYPEYSETLTVETESLNGGAGMANVLRRYKTEATSHDDGDLLELAPISMLARHDGQLVVVCRRLANYLRPSQAAVLGMNAIVFNSEWLGPALSASCVVRGKLYQRLTASRASSTRQTWMQMLIRWLAPRESTHTATVVEVMSNCVKVAVQLVPPAGLVQEDVQPFAEWTVTGWLGANSEGDLTWQEGASLSVVVTGYRDAPGSTLCELKLRYGHAQGGGAAEQGDFDAFVSCFSNHETLEVVMHEVLDDPLGRHPMFLVREPTSGLAIPMSDVDFCNSHQVHGYFGRRFKVGTSFRVSLLGIDKGARTVTLSRVAQLFAEYAGISFEQRQVVDVGIVSVDETGVYLSVGGSGYVGFVRKALVPAHLNLAPGGRVRASFRRRDSSIKIDQVRRCLEEEGQLPKDLDLGVELDLRLPIEYDKFRAEQNAGARIYVQVVKMLDSGGLLVRPIGYGVLTATVDGTELGVTEEGKLRQARDLLAEGRLSVMVTRLQDNKATVRCSVWRLAPLPADLQRGGRERAVVLSGRRDFRDATRWLFVCLLRGKYRAEVRVDNGGGATVPKVGDEIDVRITTVARSTNFVEADLESPE